MDTHARQQKVLSISSMSFILLKVKMQDQNLWATIGHIPASLPDKSRLGIVQIRNNSFERSICLRIGNLLCRSQTGTSPVLP